MAETSTKSRITPPQLARHMGVSPDKILHWIRTGELRAFNAATRVGGRPRYLISADAVAEFEKRREVVCTAKARRRTRKKNDGVIEFF